MSSYPVPQLVLALGLKDVGGQFMLGRPALSNPHWPVWAARELDHPDPFSLVPEDWGWWLRNFRAHPSCIGWPTAARATAELEAELRKRA